MPLTLALVLQTLLEKYPRLLRIFFAYREVALRLPDLQQIELGEGEWQWNWIYQQGQKDEDLEDLEEVEELEEDEEMEQDEEMEEEREAEGDLVDLEEAGPRNMQKFKNFDEASECKLSCKESNPITASPMQSGDSTSAAFRAKEKGIKSPDQAGEVRPQVGRIQQQIQNLTLTSDNLREDGNVERMKASEST